MKLNYLILIVALVSASTVKAADDSKKKKATVHELFKLQKTDKIGDQVLDQMIQSAVQQSTPDKEKSIEEAFKKEAKPNELVELLVPIYEKDFTQEELDQLIAFYKTPTGQKFINAQPQVINESSEIIQTWATKVGAKVKAKLDKKK